MAATATQAGQKKRRRTNIDERDKQLFVSILRELDGGKIWKIIKEGTSTNQTRYDAWERVTKEFNEATGKGLNREQVRAMYMRIKDKQKKKKDAKAIDRDFRKSCSTTGGGRGKSPPPENDGDDYEEFELDLNEEPTVTDFNCLVRPEHRIQFQNRTQLREVSNDRVQASPEDRVMVRNENRVINGHENRGLEGNENRVLDGNEYRVQVRTDDSSVVSHEDSLMVRPGNSSQLGFEQVEGFGSTRPSFRFRGLATSPAVTPPQRTPLSARPAARTNAWESPSAAPFTPPGPRPRSSSGQRFHDSPAESLDDIHVDLYNVEDGEHVRVDAVGEEPPSKSKKQSKKSNMNEEASKYYSGMLEMRKKITEQRMKVLRRKERVEILREKILKKTLEKLVGRVDPDGEVEGVENSGEIAEDDESESDDFDRNVVCLELILLFIKCWVGLI